jgi:hypothetical protein
MTGAANVDQNAKQALPRGRPHMTDRALITQGNVLT